MPEYRYEIDRKFTVWEKEHHTVEANNQAEADAIAIQIAKSNCNEPDYIEQIADTMASISPEENGGAPTVEVLRDTETIWANATYGTEEKKETK